MFIVTKDTDLFIYVFLCIIKHASKYCYVKNIYLVRECLNLYSKMHLRMNINIKQYSFLDASGSYVHIMFIYRNLYELFYVPY